MLFPNCSEGATIYGMQFPPVGSSPRSRAKPLTGFGNGKAVTDASHHSVVILVGKASVPVKLQQHHSERVRFDYRRAPGLVEFDRMMMRRDHIADHPGAVEAGEGDVQGGRGG